LPRQALDIIFADSQTCLSEFDLFTAISDRIQDNKSNFKEELKEIREEENSRQSNCSHGS
jgi:hypothetical protein